MLYATGVMRNPHADNDPNNSGYEHDVVVELPELLPKGNGDPGHHIAGELPEELPRRLVERLEDMQRQLGRCEGRLELAQVVESILRKQLKRESERADRADRLEEKLREAEADLRIVEDALYRARRGWFKRFFGIGAME